MKLILTMPIISSVFMLTTFNAFADKYDCIYTTQMSGYDGVMDAVAPIVVDVLGKKFTAQRPVGQKITSPELLHKFDGFYLVYTNGFQYEMSLDKKTFIVTDTEKGTEEIWMECKIQ